MVAAAGRGGSAAALARFPAVHVRQRLGADGINVRLLRVLRVRIVYMVGAGRYAPRDHRTAAAGRGGGASATLRSRAEG